jgi:hypothetical protein
MGFSVDSRLQDLIADERARAVLIKHLGYREDSRMSMVLYSTLRQIAEYPEASISQTNLLAIDADLRAL